MKTANLISLLKAPLLDSPYSGVGEGSRGYGSASLLEVLSAQRVAPRQSAIEFLLTEQNLRPNLKERKWQIKWESNER